MIFCIYCRVKNSPLASYCIGCGAPLPDRTINLVQGQVEYVYVDDFPFSIISGGFPVDATIIKETMPRYYYPAIRSSL